MLSQAIPYSAQIAQIDIDDADDTHDTNYTDDTDATDNADSTPVTYVQRSTQTGAYLRIQHTHSLAVPPSLSNNV